MLKIASVITFSTKEASSLTTKMTSEGGVETKNSTNEATSAEARRARSESVFTLSMLTFVLTAMGHGDDLSQLQGALCAMSTRPSLVRPAPETKATKAMREAFAPKFKTGHRHHHNGNEDVIPMPHLVRCAVRQHFLFAHLNDTQFSELQSSFRRLKIRVGEDVYQQDDEGTRFYVIEEGTVDVYVVIFSLFSCLSLPSSPLDSLSRALHVIHINHTQTRILPTDL